MGEGSGDSDGIERAGSEALEESVGTEESLRRDSRRKKPRRFAGTRGIVGLVMLVGDVADTADIGRLRLKASSGNCGLLRGDISKIAPAVLGRPSSSEVVLSEGRLIRTDGGVDAPPLTIDDKLPVAEWPRTVDNEVSVSEEIVDNGRMYSILSEKPTRAREGGRRGEESALSEKKPLSRSEGCETDLCAAWPKTNWSPSRGVTGALPDRAGAAESLGRMILERSCDEMAPERRWACPLRPAGGPGRRLVLGGGRMPSPFVGLELRAKPPPVRPSPPMNSLPPRLWPIGLEGVVGMSMGECGGVVAVSGP
jgi:hypothetical protein